MRRMYGQMTSNPPQGAGMDQTVATEAIVTRMSKTKNNMEFLETLNESM
jgi:transcription termination factor Rho